MAWMLRAFQTTYNCKWKPSMRRQDETIGGERDLVPTNADGVCGVNRCKLTLVPLSADTLRVSQLKMSSMKPIICLLLLAFINLAAAINVEYDWDPEFAEVSASTRKYFKLLNNGKNFVVRCGTPDGEYKLHLYTKELVPGLNRRLVRTVVMNNKQVDRDGKLAVDPCSICLMFRTKNGMSKSRRATTPWLCSTFTETPLTYRKWICPLLFGFSGLADRARKPLCSWLATRSTLSWKSCASFWVLLSACWESRWRHSSSLQPPDQRQRNKSIGMLLPVCLLSVTSRAEFSHRSDWIINESNDIEVIRIEGCCEAKHIQFCAFHGICRFIVAMYEWMCQFDRCQIHCSSATNE